MWLTNRSKALLSFVLSVVFALSCLPAAAFADQAPQKKVVRVGYVNALNYEEGGPGEHKRGSGYEYLQKISYLTGWEYEYVYGSFSDCYDMLTKGEIDLFGNVSYLPERAEVISFSSLPQGKDTYWLHTGKDRVDLASGDLDALKGCTIGVTAGSYQEGLLNDWLAQKKIKATVVPCDGFDDMMARLDAKELDAMCAPDLSARYEYSAICNIGFSDYFFGVSKQRPDLLKELDAAMNELQNSEADFNSKLASKYYYKTNGGLPFNQEERDWLAQHNATLRIGYLEDYLPFSSREGNAMGGLMGTVAETLETQYGVAVETRAYPDVTQLKDAVKKGEIDVAGPVDCDFYLAEVEGVVLTEPIAETTAVVIYSGSDYQSAMQSIAATDKSVFDRNVAGVFFPDAQITEYGSFDKCLSAINSGKAGGMVVPSARYNILQSQGDIEHLGVAELSQKVEISLFALKDQRRAATIMNKAIAQSSDALKGIVLAQGSASEGVSLQRALKEAAPVLIVVALAVILLLVLMTHRLYTSRRKLAVALDEAEAASVAKTRFLNNMSHDIRTPMNAIIGYTDIALSRDPQPQVESCLGKIKQSSEHLLSLINDVLDISRIESGKTEVHLVPSDLGALTDTVLSIAQGFTAGRDLNLLVERDQVSHGLHVLADGQRVRDVLVNIVSNAVKFTPDGGTVTFSVAYRDLGENKVMARFRIADTGIGMTPEFLEHVFDEFAQESDGARTNYTGTGLGMAIAKRYVDMMGGSIAVESAKDVGTTFTVELPFERCSEDLMPGGPVHVDASGLAGVHVLLAEDNDLNAEIATIQLEEAGLKVTRAVDGDRVVELFCQEPAGTYDVVLMDVMMPGQNGYDAARAIRALAGRPDGAQVPIIAMTANAFAEDVQASYEAGMNGHLSKPIVMDEVLQALAKSLGR
ncbi:MAG: transporter substrate-binding domain-containing protein [Coriobacteriia bacterium]|nr:transporter substrate-binding domain-containing protein [Coriobacteriia bacterium]